MYLNMLKMRGQKINFKHRKPHCNYSNVMRFALTDHIRNICQEKLFANVKNKLEK